MDCVVVELLFGDRVVVVMGGCPREAVLVVTLCAVPACVRLPSKDNTSSLLLWRCLLLHPTQCSQ